MGWNLEEDLFPVLIKFQKKLLDMRKSDHKYDQIPAVCEQNINYCWSDHEQQLFNCYWSRFEQDEHLIVTGTSLEQLTFNTGG